MIGVIPARMIGLLVQSPLPDPFHPFDELFHVKNALGLDELSAGCDLFGQAGDLDFERIGKGISSGADKQIRRSIHVLAAGEF